MPDPRPVRRIKTYTAETGHVYQYYFVGKRPALTGTTDAKPGTSRLRLVSDPPAVAGADTEYIFDVTPDRHRMYAVTILINGESVSAWAEAHGRSLTDTEQYAAAKLRLLRALDETADLGDCSRCFDLSADMLEEILEELGLD
jgi:hypothetical protein